MRYFKNISILSFGILAGASTLFSYSALAAPAATAAFSGCRGSSENSRCCTIDYEKGSGLFKMLSSQSGFGVACTTRGGELKVVAPDCEITYGASNKLQNQLRIECELTRAPLDTLAILNPTQHSADACPAPAPPTRTVSTVFPTLIAGVTDPHMLETSLKANYAHASATLLSYGFIGISPTYTDDTLLKMAERTDVTIQIGFEPYVQVSDKEIKELTALGLFPGEFGLHKRGKNKIEFSLAQLRTALNGAGNIPTKGLNAKASMRIELYNRLFAGLNGWAKRLQEHKGPVLLRPLSEMNEASARWQLSSQQSKDLESKSGGIAARAEAYADIWKALHKVFDDHGATNVKFMFTPLATKDNSSNRNLDRTQVVLEALKRIPPNQIDVLGLNVYTRTYETDADKKKNSFDALSRGWTNWLRSVPGMASKPLAVGEMGIAQKDADKKTISEESRIDWIRDAFASAKTQGYSMTTYFNDATWGCVTNKCRDALGQAIRDFQD